jgi:hypothetical protein
MLSIRNSSVQEITQQLTKYAVAAALVGVGTVSISPVVSCMKFQKLITPLSLL